MQSVLSNLPDENSIFAFVSRGLADVPGAVRATHVAAAGGESEKTASFSLRVGAAYWGELRVEVSDFAAFLPYREYLKNFCFMVAVILEERKQRRENERHQADLEKRVAERTRQLREQIAERELAEESLRLSEERFRVLVEQAPEAIVVYDMDLARFVDANSNAALLFGCGREQLLEAGPARFLPLNTAEGAGQAFDAQASRAFAGEPVVFELDVLNARGETLCCEVRLVRLPAGKQRLLRASYIDISGRKRAEEERLQLERQLQHAQKLESLGVLAGGIAHDFNNILVAILGYADLALMDLSPQSPVRGYLKEILKGAHRAADLASQMLAYSGKGRFVLKRIDLNEFVAEMAHLLEVAISKKAALRFDFARELPEFDGDPTQIRQLVMNLITNASEAIGEERGVITIRTGVMHCRGDYLAHNCAGDSLSEGEYVFLEVADTGCGMTPETQARIFEPFFTTKFTGRGLGMAALLGIVRGHRGAIKLYSEPGKGSTFKVLLPAARGKIRPATEERKRVGAAQAPLFEGKILLADDDPSVRRLGERMLQRLGFEVVLAVDGAHALELFRAHQAEFVCVVLDLTMPKLDGEECFRELRRIDSQMPVLVSSGYDEQEVTQRFLGKDLSGFVRKPYQLETLREKLLQVLGA